MGTNHTPGPWRWEVNEKAKSVKLVGSRGNYVMTFDRWGMQGAQVNFREFEVGYMQSTNYWTEAVPGREHHADWFKTLYHPDALLIQAAPDLLESAIRAFKELMDAGYEDASVTSVLKSAIEKATGQTKPDPTR